MKALEEQFNDGRNLNRGGKGHCWLLRFLKYMVVVSILLPTFALPTANAETLTISTDGTGDGTVMSDPAGISCPGDCTEDFANGAVVTVTATPAAGSTFTNWSGAAAAECATGSVVMSANKSCTANFTLQQFTLTLTTGGSGTGTVTGGGPYTAGATATVTATPAAGSTFTNWSGAAAAECATGSVVMSANKSCTANFTLQQFTLTLTTGGSGTGTVTGGGPYTAGATATVTATPAAGSTFTNWSGAAAAECATGSVVMSANKSCTANFTLQQFTLTLTTGGSGTGTVTGGGPYTAGATATVTATPAAGSTFTNWSGAAAAECATGSVVMSANKSCTANFTLQQFTLTLTTGGSGTGTVTGGGPYTAGATATVTATPAAGSTFTNWSGAAAAECATGSVVMSANKSCTANFTLQQFTLTLTTGGSGTGTVTGGGPYTAGATATVTATPAAGSTFTNWSGAAAAECATGSVVMSANKSCTANFTLQQFTLTLTTGGSGTGTVTGGGPYTAGATATVTATPAAGSTFTNWSGAAAAECATGSVVMSANKSCTANFTLQQFTLTLTTGGSGTGTVTGGGPYTAGATATVTATPAAGSTFTNWSGAAAAECATGSVVMSANKSCTANFTLQQFTLTLVLAGKGKVTSVPAGINCGVDCVENFPNGTVVRLTPTPDSGWQFSKWSGAGDCTDGSVTMTGSLTCTAKFALIPIKVPNVVGSTQTAAQGALINAGLRVGAITKANHASVPSGRVISQTPAAGASVAPGSAVALVVSVGPVVPNVVGLTQASAQTAITGAGLTVGTVTTANSPTVPIGRVISQNPTAGTSVAAGSAVAFVVSLGAAVPNVAGLTQAAAQTAITGAGLTVGTVTTANSPTVPIGRVISQNPTAGTNVAAGSAVALVVSLGAQVPNVVGLTQGAAQTALTTAGVIVGTVTTAISATVPIGAVIGQKPGAGTHVAPGSAVALVISSGPPAFLMGVQNDPNTGPLVNSLYRLRTDGVVTKIGDLTHRTHGLAFVGSTLYSVEELTLSPQAGTPPKMYRLNPDTGATLATVSLSLSTAESLEGGRGLATEPGTNQLWGLLVVTSEVNSARRLVTINPTTGVATQKAKLFGNFMDLAFDAAGTLYVITDNRPVSGGAVFPARIYTVNKTTGATTEFLDVSAGAVAGQPNFRESETIGMGPSSDFLYHLSGQYKVTSGFTKNILFETIHRTTKARTAIALTGPDFFVTTALTLVPPTSPPALGDLDASGTTDLIWRNQSDGSTAIWLMNGTTIAASGFPGGVPRVWQIAGVGDVNGDGKADVIWRNGTTGTVAVWLMNGVSVTKVGFPGSASTAFEIMGVGDVNGDGKADLVWRNQSDGSTAIWLMNGTAIAASGFPGGVPVAWQIEGVGDVNGDNRADVIWRNGTSGGVAMWLMNGLSVTTVGFVGSAPTAFEIAGVGDVNGDGKADLFWRNQSDGSTAIWLMNGTAITTAGFPGGVPVTWQISQVGDVNGDGNADIIWRNGKSATVAVWLMNGLSISTVGFPGSAPSDWEIQ